MSEIFAKRLKEEREAKGWSQKYLAEMLNLTNGTISGYERNYREPDFLTLSKITELLNVSAAYLLGETDQKQKGVHECVNGKTADISSEEMEAITLIRKSWSRMTPKQRQKRLDFLKNYTKLVDPEE